jgi:glycosyltransferase involved in cell wall biosynthesis
VEGKDDKAVGIATRFYHPYPSAGGAEVQAERLARYLAANGQICEIVTTRYRGDLPAREVGAGVDVRRLPTRRPLSRLVEFVTAFVWFFVNGGRFRVVHALCLSAFTLGAVLGAGARGARTIVLPCTVGARGDIAHVRKGPVGRLLWRLFGTADVMLARTRAGAAELDATGIPRTKVTIVPALLDLMLDRPPGPAERTAVRAAIGLPDRPIALYVGRLVEAKGVGLILEAWPQVAAHHKATLVLVGNGPLRARAVAVAKALDDSEGIRVVGRVEHPEPYYRAAEIFIYPSDGEAFGLALGEAMAAGLAVIATRTGLATDWIRDGEDGLIVETRDAVGLARAISSLLSAESRRRSLGLKALLRAREAFAPDRVGAAYLELHRRLLDVEGLSKQR